MFLKLNGIKSKMQDMSSKVRVTFGHPAFFMFL